MSDRMFYAIHLLSALLWLAAAIWLSGSLWRFFTGRPIRNDRMWSLACLIAFWVVGFRVRVFTGYTPLPSTPDQFYSDMTMQVVGCFLAVGVMWIRHGNEGWRW